jgi:hypothetical protein
MSGIGDGVMACENDRQRESCLRALPCHVFDLEGPTSRKLVDN